MDRDAEAELATLRRRQRGAFAVHQAVALGVSEGAVRMRLDRGTYRSLLPGVLVDAGAPDSRDLRAQAALLWAGGDAALARGTAAWILDIDGGRPVDDLLHLIVRSRTFKPQSGIVVHRTTRLAPWDVTNISGLRTTTGARTVIDLAGDVGPDRLRRTLSAAVRAGTRPSEIRATLDQLGRVRGRRQLVTLLDELSPLMRHTREELESMFLRLTTRAGMPPTHVNHAVRDVNGKRKLLDAAYLPEHLPIELDSRRYHGTLLDWHDDTRRENDILLDGRWRPFLRFSFDDVKNHADEVLDRIRVGLRVARDAIE